MIMVSSTNGNADSDMLYEHFNMVADPGQSPIRIDKFLLDRMTNVSRNRIQNAIRAGSVTVNAKSIKPNYKIRPGDHVVIILPHQPNPGSDVKPEKMELDIRYEDDHLMVIHKPAGLVVHPGISNYSGTLVNGLKYYFDDQVLPTMKGNTLDRPGLVHRIDKNTSGLLVIAKTEFAMTHLARQFFNHSIHREYVALVWGEPEQEGVFDLYLGRDPRDRLKIKAFDENEAGKRAVTHYQVIKSFYYVSLVRCWLETGRTHQIRVHFSHAGFPVFNDERYGGDRIVKGTVFTKYKQFVQNCFKLIPRHALHAKTLSFIHPATKKKMVFDSDLPEDMQAVLEKWDNYVTHQKDKMNR